jgi:hypothetical protein
VEQEALDIAIKAPVFIMEEEVEEELEAQAQVERRLPLMEELALPKAEVMEVMELFYLRSQALLKDQMDPNTAAAEVEALINR